MNMKYTHTYISKLLKFKNNKIYWFLPNEIQNENFEENNYYTDISDIKMCDSFDMNNHTYKYDILINDSEEVQIKISSDTDEKIDTSILQNIEKILSN